MSENTTVRLSIPEPIDALPMKVNHEEFTDLMYYLLQQPMIRKNILPFISSGKIVDMTSIDGLLVLRADLPEGEFQYHITLECGKLNVTVDRIFT